MEYYATAEKNELEVHGKISETLPKRQDQCKIGNGTYNSTYVKFENTTILFMFIDIDI